MPHVDEPVTSSEHPRDWPLNETLPPGNNHAVSVSMPKWDQVNRYVHKLPMKQPLVYGYPRIFIHPNVRALGSRVVSRIAAEGAGSVPFPTTKTAERCLQFLKEQTASVNLRIVNFELPAEVKLDPLASQWTHFHAVVFPQEYEDHGRNYFRWAGDGVSSRHAELLLNMFDTLKDTVHEPKLQVNGTNGVDGCEGRNGVDGHGSLDGHCTATDSHTWQNGGNCSTLSPNLDLVLNIGSASLAREGLSTHLAKLASSELSGKVTADDVLLYPTGMSSIHASARAARSLCPSDRSPAAIMFGFPYTDTPKMLRDIVWEDSTFLGNSTYDDLEALILEKRIWALFCEFPTNPLLDTPDLPYIQQLAHKHDFLIVCDETVGTLVNVDIMQYVDVVCTSLTKISSGAGDVMGGSAIVSPRSRHRHQLLAALKHDYEDIYFPPDVRKMEYNCRDMAPRIRKVNGTTSRFCAWFDAHPLVARVYHPETRPTKHIFDRCLKPHGGYGYLLSIIFHEDVAAQAFYNALDVAKGPSLGLNFTLGTAYTLLAHHGEMEWAAEYGVVEFLVRISFGLEEPEALEKVFVKAMEAAKEAVDGKGLDEPKGAHMHE